MRTGYRIHSKWYAKWVVLTCAFCNYVLIDGVRFSFGVLYVELLNTFRAGKGETAWIGSVQIGIFNLAGVIAGSIARKIGIIKTIIAGTLLSSIGLFVSTFSTNIYIMYVTFGLLPGLGFIMMGLSCVVAVSRNFEKRRSLAMGITQAGGSVGGFVFNPVLQYFIDNYGWKGALWLMSAIVLHGLLIAMVINVIGVHDEPERTEEVDTKLVSCEQTKLMISGDRFYVDSFGSMTLKIEQPQNKHVVHDEPKRTEGLDNTQASWDQTKLMSSCDRFYVDSFGSTTLKIEQLQTQNKHDVIQNGNGHMNTYIHNKSDLNREEHTNCDNCGVSDEINSIEINSQVGFRTPEGKKRKGCLSILNTVFPYRVLCDRRLCIFLISALIRAFGFFTPFMLLPDLAVEDQINIEKAAWLASAMGISGAVSRVLLGWIADFRHVDRLYLYIFCLLGSGILSAVAPSLQLYGLLMFYASVFGCLMGGECCLTPVLCADVAGKDKLAESYGMLQTLCGLGAMCGTPLSGWLFEVTGGYSVPFIMSGTIIAVSGVLLLPLKCKKCH